MTCADVEILLCDYLDGTLAPSERAELEQHLGSCANCAEFAADAGAGLTFLEHVPDVQPPQELVTRIMHQAPTGGLVESLQKSLSGGGAFKQWLHRMLEPIRQPRYVYGAMMTILSLTMMTRCAGVPVRDLKADDLTPQRIWVNLETKTERIYDRSLKTYESMRVVYEIRQTLRQWREQQQEQDAAAAGETREIPLKSDVKSGGDAKSDGQATAPAAPGVPGKN